MSSLHAGGARLFGPLLAAAMAALAAGCEAGITGTAEGPALVEQPQGGAPPPVTSSADLDAELVYDPDGPVDDIEGYPFVVYGGANVYFVEGRWYRHGQGGWGYYRNEPPELGRQREMHQQDARWTRPPAPPLRAAPASPGVAERQGPERVAPPTATPEPTKAVPEAKKKKAAKKAAPAHAEPTREPEREDRR
jgi:hypothetical protein